jgi:hypothetical protein
MEGITWPIVWGDDPPPREPPASAPSSPPATQPELPADDAAGQQREHPARKAPHQAL